MINALMLCHPIYLQSIHILTRVSTESWLSQVLVFQSVKFFQGTFIKT